MTDTAVDDQNIVIDISVMAEIMCSAELSA
jgi:hypothetical protein